jgi:hypothetical protein
MDQNEIDALVDDIRDGVFCAWDTFGWVKGFQGADGTGYCAVGAIQRATNYDYQLLTLFRQAASETIDDLFPGRPAQVESFNDMEFSTEEDLRLMMKHSFEKMKDMLGVLINPPATDEGPAALEA